MLQIKYCLVVVMFFALASTINAQTGSEVTSNIVKTIIGQITTTNTTCDPNSSEEQFKEQIHTNFHITMNEFNKDNLLWACQKFNELKSKTRFFEQTKPLFSGYKDSSGKSYGIYIKMVDSSPTKYSSMNGCVSGPNTPTISLHPHSNQELFQLTILHEIGHVIHNCVLGQASNRSLFNQFEGMFPNTSFQDSGLTAYSRNPGCTGVQIDNLREKVRNESFAEMTTYFLNPTAKERQITNCPPDDVVPYEKMVSPFLQYPQIAQSVYGQHP